MKLTRNKAIGAVVILLALALAFFYGGRGPTGQTNLSVAPGVQSLEEGERQETQVGPKAVAVKLEAVQPSLPSPEAEAQSGPEWEEEPPQEEAREVPATMELDPEAGKDRYLTDPIPEGKPVPVEPQDVEIGTGVYTCTLTVVCHTILDNMAWLDPEKVELVPEDGVIFATKTVTFYEGESVFNLLQREMKAAGIHMEFSSTPIYNSAYIEGIHNLYEFDCGELSGWMYKVNNWFPNYGCSRYQLRQDDVIEWIYTCDLGRDIGGYYAVGGS